MNNITYRFLGKTYSLDIIKSFFNNKNIQFMRPQNIIY